ncbi:TPA: hypothetical protein PL523_003388 [Cronobacter turicensis]|nr:hypothetical protein G9G38_21730 [Cronobacter sp. EKM102R]HDI3022871.1 hypothetical protein [Cronobacter turicensis]HDI3035495.1 hypothetical protein [Cronobacter turicensis]
MPKGVPFPFGAVGILFNFTLRNFSRVPSEVVHPVRDLPSLIEHKSAPDFPFCDLKKLFVATRPLIVRDAFRFDVMEVTTKDYPGFFLGGSFHPLLSVFAVTFPPLLVGTTKYPLVPNMLHAN